MEQSAENEGASVRLLAWEMKSRRPDDLLGTSYLCEAVAPVWKLRRRRVPLLWQCLIRSGSL